MTGEETGSAVDSGAGKSAGDVELDKEEDRKNFRTIENSEEIAEKERFEDMRLTRDKVRKI